MPFTGVCPANGLNAPAIAATTARPSAIPLKSTHRGSRRQTTANASIAVMIKLNAVRVASL